MADKTKIEWTTGPDGTPGATWNPVRGCSSVSEGCRNCFAARIASRGLPGMRSATGEPFAVMSGGRPQWTGRVELIESALEKPLYWRRPRRIFVNSMSDLFHERLRDEDIDRVFAVMALCQQHTFLVLSKRPERMRGYVGDSGTPFRILRQISYLEGKAAIGAEDILPIAGFDGYFASSHGFIYSDKRGTRRKMRPDRGDQGHLRVQLHREGKPGRRGERFLVHRLILETFFGPPPSADSQGRHLDGNPENNAISNLAWGGQGENWSDSRRHGTHRRYAKLTDHQALEIRQRYGLGESGEALAREFRVSATQVRNIARGAQWNVAPEIEWPLKNCWLGVSVEDQAAADARIPHLLQTPAALRFVSVEPMLGPVKIPDKALCPCSYCVGGKPHPYCAGQPRIDWVICGGETGPSARPMHPAWARDLRDQCIAAGVPFFFKQWGDWAPCGPVEDSADFFGSRVVQSNSGGWSSVSHYLQTGRFADMGDDVIMERAGKARAGHLLDGREWRQFPHINHENTPIPEKRI